MSVIEAWVTPAAENRSRETINADGQHPNQHPDTAKIAPVSRCARVSRYGSESVQLGGATVCRRDPNR